MAHDPGQKPQGFGFFNEQHPPKIFYSERDSQAHHEDFHAITATPEYGNISFEELRLADYAARPFSRPHILAQAHFPLSHRLVSAPVPNRCSKCQPTLDSRRSEQGSNHPFFSRLITIRVGKESTHDFMIQRALVTSRSEFMRAAVEKDWKEAKEGLVRFPEDSIEAFGIYHHFLYTGRVLSKDPNSHAGSPQEYERLVQAYILGDKLMDGDYKDIIIDCIVHKLNETCTFDPNLTTLVYESTASHSPLRRLWLDVYVWLSNAQWLNEDATGVLIDADFLVDLGKAHTNFWGGHRPKHAPFMGNRCAYHEHASGICYLTKDGTDLRWGLESLSGMPR